MAKAITVKVLPATAAKPTRYKAYDSDGNFLITGAPIAYGHAAKLLCDRMQWGGVWVGSQTSKISRVFVRVNNIKPAFTGA